MPLITFTSDFGLNDVYVGVVHGVIAGIAPHAHIVDLTHGIPSQDVRAGALALYAGCSLFPPGTIHLAVVDPGVGTLRRALLLRTTAFWYIGPDNGLFTLAAPTETLLGCWELTNREYHLPTLSATFHGRDLFAPVAAHLANGVRPEELGTPASMLLALPDLALHAIGRGQTSGTVLTVDHFGNMVTNLQASELWREGLTQRRVTAWLGDLPLRPVRTYGQGRMTIASTHPAPDLLLLAGSAGLLEVAVANGDAARTTGLGVGAPVRVVVD